MALLEPMPRDELLRRVSMLCAREITKFGDLEPIEVEAICRDLFRPEPEGDDESIEADRRRRLNTMQQAAIVLRRTGSTAAPSYIEAIAVLERELDELLGDDGPGVETPAEIASEGETSVYDGMVTNPHSRRMRVASGEVDDDRALVAFLYRVARDHAYLGDLEGVLHDILDRTGTYRFTNGWLASWAQDAADRLTASARPHTAADCPFARASDCPFHRVAVHLADDFIRGEP